MFDRFKNIEQTVMAKKNKYVSNFFELMKLFIFYVFILNYNPIEYPIIMVLLFGLYCVISGFGIYNKIQYSKGKYPDELRYPTQNDTNSKVSSMTLGGIVVSGGVACLILLPDFMIFACLALVEGCLMFINGVLDLPNGQVKIKKRHLYLSENEESIALDEIVSVDLKISRFVVEGKGDKKLVDKGLQLDEEWMDRIEAFLRQRIDKDEKNLKISKSTDEPWAYLQKNFN